MLIYFKYLFSIFYSHISFWGFSLCFHLKQTVILFYFTNTNFLLIFIFYGVSINFRNISFSSRIILLIFYSIFAKFSCLKTLFFLPQFDLWLSLKIYSCVYIYILIDIIHTVFHMPQLELPQSCIIFPFNVLVSITLL